MQLLILLRQELSLSYVFVQISMIPQDIRHSIYCYLVVVGHCFHAAIYGLYLLLPLALSLQNSSQVPLVDVF